MKRVLAIGDIHGAFRALKQCLERSKFDYENDTLITLGDIVDGWGETYECVEELLKIKNRIDIKGNHDDWFQTYFKTGMHPTEWRQGGEPTRDSYLKQIEKQGLVMNTLWGSISALNPGDIPDSHKKFFTSQVYYYIYKGEMCFTHGGFDRDYPIDMQHAYTLMWDRNLWEKAKSMHQGGILKTVDNFKKIFIGHTQCKDSKNPEALPITKGGITNLDTGGGWDGKLTIMDVNTDEFWQSDFVKHLYPEEKGRF